MITSSEFYSRLNALENNRKLGITYLRAKNIEISDNASIPTIIGKIAAIPNPSGEGGGGTTITTSGSVVILSAELANRTLELSNSDGTILQTKTTDSLVGGAVSFSLSSATTATYTITAKNSDGEILWTNSVDVTGIGIYTCKSSLKLAGYTWEEVNITAKNHYAQYMFDVWDSKTITSFMGSTSANYRTFYILGFDHDNKADGSGKAGITFMCKTTASTYKHHSSSSTNVNGVSWVGSLIRANCLKSGDSYYVYDHTVTSTTEGDYFVLEDDGKSFTAVTLPADYDSNTKFYKITTLTADGAFVAGLTDVNDYIVQVEKKTWGGYGAGVSYSTDTKVVTTLDWMFIPSDSEIFGDGDRFVSYSKYAIEGETYEAFKSYKENRFRFGDSRWLRSPYLSYSNYFCCWNTSGFVGNGGAGATYRLPLCFCL